MIVRIGNAFGIVDMYLKETFYVLVLCSLTNEQLDFQVYDPLQFEYIIYLQDCPMHGHGLSYSSKHSKSNCRIRFTQQCIVPLPEL